MIRSSLRCAFVAVAATVLTQLPMSAPALAGGSCGSGTPFAGSAAGTVDYNEYQDWWQTLSAGGTTLTGTATNTFSYLEAWDATCGTRLCRSEHTYTHYCDVQGYTGVLNVVVGAMYGWDQIAYTVTATPNGSGVPAVTVPAQCSDGLDNDLDGRTDYAADPGCSNSSDNSESESGQTCSLVLGAPVCVLVENGPVQQSLTAYGPRAYDGPSHAVAGRIDLYRFPLPTGGTAALPCVVLGSSPGLCTATGGTYAGTIAVLVDRSVNQPGVALDQPLATVRVCAAEVTVTVARIGVEEFPAYSVC